jgi:hypothetical protein
MKTMKQKEIKNLIKIGAAVDITNKETNEDIWRNIERIAVSRGIHGMNGGLLKDKRNGVLYAITARNSNLFYYF